MKVRRTIGGALFGIGCAVTFVGILATVLPMVQNDQLQLVLSSFEMPSGNLIVSAINGAMTYALHHCYGVLLCGIVMMAAGMAILLHRTRGRPVRHNTPSSYSRPASAPRPKARMAGRGCRLVGMEAAGKQGQIPLQEQSMRSFPPARRLRQFRRPIPRLPSCRPPTPRMNLRPMRGPFEEAPTPPPPANPPVPPVAAPPAPEASEPSAAETPYAAPAVSEPAAETVPPPAPKLSASSSTPPVAPARARGRYTQPERLTCDDSFDHCFQGRKARAGTGIPSACADIFPKGGAGWHRVRAQ